MPRDLSSGGTLEIRALDPNLFAYTTDAQAARAGIEGGSGVFGAVTVSRLTF